MRINIGTKTFDRSILIPSISSFETRVSGSNALALQQVLREPISLVSAFDLKHDEALNERVGNFRSQGGLIFLDSGGYESSRIQRYFNNLAPPPINADNIWSFGEYSAVATRGEYDLVASFDYYIEDTETYTEFHDRYLSALQDHDFIEDGKLVPVLHVKSRKGDEVLDRTQWLDLLEAIASNLNCSLIAIPERELGSGLQEKVSFAKEIVVRIAKYNDCKLHILGCGNPLSFALFSQVGVAVADGLEWCRTFYGSNYHLFHFQHFDILKIEKQIADNPFIEAFRDSGLEPEVLALVYNLQAQQDFSLLLSAAIRNGNVFDFLEEQYPIADEVRKVIAG